VPDEAQAAAHQNWCRKARQDFQGLAAAYVRVTAEPRRAEQIAVQRAEVAVGVLRFFAPAHFYPRMVSRIDFWGHAPLRSGAVFFANNDGLCTRFSAALVDSIGALVLDDPVLSVLFESGLSEIQGIVSRDDRNEFEEALVSGILLFGRAALTTDMRQRLVWYCSALESMLLRNNTESATQNLAERLAIGAYETLNERRQAIADVRNAYDMRSKFMHHGSDVQEADPVLKFARHGLRLFVQLARKAKQFQTKNAFIEHVESVKLS